MNWCPATVFGQKRSMDIDNKVHACKKFTWKELSKCCCYNSVST